MSAAANTIDWAASQSRLEQTFGVALQMPQGVDTAFGDWRELSRLVAALARARGARVIAVSGSQGSGKTTFSDILTQTCNSIAVGARACSIDDFYLSRADRHRLAQNVHPLLQTRGVPGTHEWQWLGEVLHSVRQGAAEVTLPVFDKGLDDRAGTVAAQVETLVLEGWCLGVTAQPDSMLTEPCNELEAQEDPQGFWRSYVNTQVRDHYEPLWRQVDLWVHLRVPGFAQVVTWRTQQEQQLPAEQRMSPPEIRRFVAHYERITRWLWASPPLGPGVVVTLDENHRAADFTASAAPQISP